MTKNLHSTIALVVDDDPYCLAAHSQMVRKLGILKVYECETAKHAIQCVKEHPHHPMLIVCDLAMPDTDGLELLSLLPTTNTQISFLFVSNMPASLLSVARVLAHEAGFKVIGAISKPLTPSRLNDAIILH